MKKHVFSKTYIGLLSFLLFMGFYTEGVAQCSCTDCRCSDSLALVAFYNATGGQTWTTKNNNGQQSPWVLSQSMTTWYGIRLNANGRVECLDLDGMNDCEWNSANGLNLTTNSGIPVQIGNLTDLKRLYIGYNRNLIGNIPVSIGQLSKLEKLYLESNGFIGSIPAEIGQLTNLSSLALANNKLNGDIPNTLNQLRNLIELYLYTNRLNGSIPSLNLLNLKYLLLSDNQLTGQIPDFNLPNLENFSIFNNPQLGGEIPTSLGNSRKLQYINISNCGLTQSIPSSLANLDSLIAIALSDNQLTGTIPNFQSKKLTQILLWRNKLSGSIPDFDLPELWGFNVEGNKTISGNVPEFRKCPKLVFFNARDNILVGDLPSYEWLKDSLQYLLLDNNKINATTIPAYNLPKLKSLSIG